jgi:hypothetical protein
MVENIKTRGFQVKDSAVLTREREHVYGTLRSVLKSHKDPLQRRAIFDWFAVVKADARRVNISALSQSGRIEGGSASRSLAAQKRAEKEFFVAQRRLRKNVSARKALVGKPENDKYLLTNAYLERFYSAACDAERAVMHAHSMHTIFSEVEVEASVRSNIIEILTNEEPALVMKRRTQAFPKRDIIFHR